MKILRIAVRNIASLSGIQVVDFTVDPLRSTGLFSITGVTGAGKSSLLDAMCLALYDTTPRLSRLGRLAEVQGEKPADPRALLRRGTAEGFAEVTFRGVDEQIWTARWSVRRSHLRVDGSLQSQEMVLLHGIPKPGGQGQPASAGTRSEVKFAIQEKIGLDFHQFTRAVLLAQNEFSQFLKADDKARGEILQLLTGTEVFEQLSKAAFLRYTTERRELDQLRMMMQGLTPMPSADRLMAEETLKKAKRQFNELAAKLKVNSTGQTWHQQFQQLGQQQLHVNAELNALNTRQQEIQELRGQLQIAEQVHRELRVLREKERQLADDCLSLEQDIASLSSTELETRSRLNELVQLEKQLAGDLDRMNQLLQDLAPKFREADRLQGNIAAAEASLALIEKEVLEAENSFARKKTEMEGLTRSILNLESELAQIDSRRLLVSIFAPFQNDVMFYQNLIEQVDKLLNGQHQLTLEMVTKDCLLQQEKANLQKLEGQRQEVEQQVRQASVYLDEAAGKLARLNYDQICRNLADYRDTQLQLLAFSSDFRELTQLRTQLHELTAAEERDQDALKSSQSQQLELERQLAQAKDAFDGASQMLNRIKAAIDDAAIRLRVGLIPDQECPVCGSTSHPYSEHPPDYNLLAVKAAESVFNERSEDVSRITKDVTSQRSLIQFLGQSLVKSKESRLKIDANIQQISSRMTDHPIRSRYPVFSPDLSQETGSQLQELAKELNEKIRALEEADREFRSLQLKIDELRSEHKKSEGELSSHDALVRAAANTVQRIEQEYLQLKLRLDECATQLDDQISQLDPVLEAIPEARQLLRENTREFLSRFTDGVESSRRLSEELIQTDSKLQVEKRNQTECDQILGLLSQSVLSKTHSAESVRESVQQLKLTRSQLFSGEDPQQFEEARKAEIKLLDAKNAEIRKQRESLQGVLTSTQATLHEKSNLQQKLRSQLDQTSAAVKRWIEDCRFLLESQRSREHIDRILSFGEDWFTDANLRISAHDRQLSELNGMLSQLQLQIDKHANARGDTPELESLQAEEQLLNADLATADNEVERALTVIKIDDQRIQENAERLRESSVLEERIRPWERLNELIGSAEGQKFRGIAQRRTLDILLRYANVHLNQFAPRYRLERTTESLNLTVIDREMGDERRSVHSLSGGETFLASLALALGLASLASNRLKIESLFIDEGFGSLDQETLSTAIGALMQLEAQGRKVGVISHVSEMSEAIPVQIRIQKQKAGASKIVVPGARELALFEDQPPTITPELVAEQILANLRTALQSGRGKVSLASLRSTIGCTMSEFKLGQQLIASKVEVEGKSLRLRQPNSGGSFE